MRSLEQLALDYVNNLNERFKDSGVDINFLFTFRKDYYVLENKTDVFNIKHYNSLELSDDVMLYTFEATENFKLFEALLNYNIDNYVF